MQKDYFIETAKKIKLNGIVSIYDNHKWEVIYIDNEEQFFDSKNCVYVYADNDLFLTFLLLKAYEEKLIRLSERLDKFLPFYKWAGEFKFKDLLNNEFVIEDLYVSKLADEYKKTLEMTSFDEFIKHKKEVEFEHSCFEQEDHISFLSNLKKRSISEESDGPTIRFLKKYILRCLFKDSIDNLLIRYFFTPLGIKAKKNYYIFEKYYTVYRNEAVIELDTNIIRDYYCLTQNDLKKIAPAIKSNTLTNHFSLCLNKKNNWQGPIYEQGGFINFPMDFLDMAVVIFINTKNNVLGYRSLNSSGTVIYDPINAIYFSSLINDYIYANYFKLNFPKLIRLKKLSDYDMASTIDVFDYQRQFMCSGAVTLAYEKCLPKEKVYVLKDNNVVVGICKIEINPKENNFGIYNFTIDKKFQNKGYGKIMLKQALEVIRESGIKEMRIDVEKTNEFALKTYLACGFLVVSTCSWGYSLIYCFS